MNFHLWVLHELINAQAAIFEAREAVRRAIWELPVEVFSRIHLHARVCTPIHGVNTSGGNHTWSVIVKINPVKGGPRRTMGVFPIADFPNDVFKAQMMLLS